MRNDVGRTVAICAIGLDRFAGTAAAQAPAAPATSASSAVENPTYVVIPMEITVNRPVAEVWKRVGPYCAIAEWFPLGLHDHRGQGQRSRRGPNGGERNHGREDRIFLHLAAGAPGGPGN